MTESALPTPALLQYHLHGVSYPATRDRLLLHARRECERLISTLALLPDREYSRPADVSRAFGEIARRAVKGANYPLTRDDLIRYAEDEGTETVIIEALHRIPDREYDNPYAVAIEIIEV